MQNINTNKYVDVILSNYVEFKSLWLQVCLSLCHASTYSDSQRFRQGFSLFLPFSTFYIFYISTYREDSKPMK